MPICYGASPHIYTVATSGLEAGRHQAGCLGAHKDRWIETYLGLSPLYLYFKSSFGSTEDSYDIASDTRYLFCPPFPQWFCISSLTTIDKNDEKEENSCQEHNRCFKNCKTLQMFHPRCYLVHTGHSSLCRKSTVSICPLFVIFNQAVFYCSFWMLEGDRQTGGATGRWHWLVG